ncbi:hypothetical protein DL96DRAFT_1720675 [Flagelloscypha sp. PMI_526]|nr:hypothetical protein DL96DRAFT_1720675 [Flagelloscypha sp. PMI_526]
MMFFRSLLLLLAATLSVVTAASIPTYQNISARAGPPKLDYNILPPNAPAIRTWVDLFHRLLRQSQGDPPGAAADTAEIRRRYMWQANRRYPNSVFYVNQRRINGMDNDNPNWGTTRALQLREILERQLGRWNPDAESWTLYQAYDTREAFGLTNTETNRDTPSDIRRAALSLGQERDWFRWTSAAFAEMATGDVFLVVEEDHDAIGSDSIWATHELPAIQRSEGVERILEVRPANVGEVLAGRADLDLFDYRDPNALRRHPTHGDPNPTPAPAPPGPPDHDSLKRGLNRIDVKVDEKKALDARTTIDIDLSDARDIAPPDPIPEIPPKPTPPYKEGTCRIHVKEWENYFGTDWLFGIEVSMYDDPTKSPDPDNRIGYVERTNIMGGIGGGLEMASKLEDKLTITPWLGATVFPQAKFVDFLVFDLADQHWKSTDADRCSVGGYNDRKREMDCHFACQYGGKPSSDGSRPPGAAAANAIIAGNAVTNAAIDSGDSSGLASTNDDNWIPVIIGLVIANLVIAVLLAMFNIVGKLRGTLKLRNLSLSQPINKEERDNDVDEVPSLKNSSYTH